ncbi:DUF2917 domain-containing protein [Paraburkholderia sp. J76]|uniref:DUF2917 domain-containing protein n=1 Tax=Paraburkholderia sp. J76 TaxID=2805439 RepID=UPI002ABDB1BD|nr:DUF2917 domain-containing protein [Paraburkholderia sp. J76]
MGAGNRADIGAESAGALALWVACDACRTIRLAQGGVVAALEGRVWMTVEGDAGDYWLEPGEAIPLAPGERARIGGWREAVRFEVRSEVEPAAQPHEWCFGRLRTWLSARLRVRFPARLPARLPARAAQARNRAVPERVA